MNDFLQFVDRVPTLPNRKKITHADSSVEYATVEYADEPVETGTPLSKTGFDRLNSVLGYNDVRVEKNTIEIPTTTRAYLKSSTTSSQGRNNNYSVNILTTQDGENIELNYNLALVSIYGDNEYSWSNSTLNQCFGRTSYDSVVRFGLYTSNNKIYIDFKKTRHIKVYYRVNSSSSLVCKYGVNSLDTQWEAEPNTNATYEFNGRYFQISGADYQTAYVYYLYFDISDTSTNYKNDYTLDNFEFVNNKKVYIKTPINFDANVNSSFFNNIQIENNLSPNSYYELVYDNNLNIIKTSQDKILFDITLQQDVQRIELTGIWNMLKKGGIYLITLYGSVTTKGTYDGIRVGNNLYMNTSTSNENEFAILFIDNTDYKDFSYITNPAVSYNSTGTGAGIRNNYEYIATTNTSAKIRAGSRIIIKEIS